MVFTAYFDESGTHAGAEVSGIAGLLEMPGSGGNSRSAPQSYLRVFELTYSIPST